MVFLENELEACQKSIDAQFSSSIDCDKEGKRKRNRKAYLVFIYVMLNFIKCFIFIVHRPYRYGESLGDEIDHDYNSESSENNTHITINQLSC